jgi:tetratricopeptide (TPR) repeat protein
VPDAGELLGPYRLIAPLGRGAMGEVWRARDERLDRYVALKVLPADLAADAERRARMLREARAAAAIRHANVVTLFDIVEHRGDDILVMELVEGRTLSDVLRKDGAPALDVALKWITGVAEALVAAHASRILHRDIKAANVMVTNDGNIKVLDFGLAKQRDANDASASLANGAKPSSSFVERIALDATMPSEGSVTIDSYETRVGSLLGTPMYMSPEQLDGLAPDERSEVFSVGVLAFEILAGKPPYKATSMDELEVQIKTHLPPPIAKLPASVDAIVQRALAKDPRDRWQSMRELRDAIAGERERLFAAKPRRWPIAVALAAAVALGTGGVAWWLSRAAPERPGDAYVVRALEQYDAFKNDEALPSLRAALRVAPEHPRANAYMILFGNAPAGDRATALEAARRAAPNTSPRSRERALLDAAITYAERGPRAARDALVDAGAERDRELAFWTAELDWRSSAYARARDEYKTLLDEPAPQFRGRIYDHYSSLLLYFDDPVEALRIGTLYRDQFPGEADAVAVYATTLAAAGRLDDAVRAAEDALRLNEGEDTLAGLAKVLALRGDRVRAKQLYARSLDRAGPARRPLRRAALALLQWIDGELDAARATVAPCLPGGADADARERGACLFVAGAIDPARAEDLAGELDRLAASASETNPAYGTPASLAALLRARARFFAGACILDAPLPAAPPAAFDGAAYALPVDFYAAYHVPFVATWSVCERAALLAARGDRAGAVELLRPIAERAPGRRWIERAIERDR